MKNSDIVANFLKEKQIKIVFGIIGSANSHIFDSINNLNYTQIINVHHEQAAVMAMGAFFRASGKLSASIVTAGAGAANAITGVVSNWADSIPGIILSGNESSYHIKEHANLRMFGTQGFDVTKMVKDVTKYSKFIDENTSLQDELEKAHYHSISDRPGPCWIDIPFNLQVEESEFRAWNKIIHVNKNDIDVDEIVNLVNESKRPLLLGGHGIRLSGASEIFKSLVDELKIPTCLSWSGIDLLSSANENYFGRFGIYGQRGANFIVQNTDLLIVIGSRLSLPQTGYDFSSFARDAKIIIIDIDEIQAPKEFVNKHYKIDAKYFLNELTLNKSNFNEINSDWIEYCNKIRLNFPLEEKEYFDDDFVNSYKFIDKLSNHLKKDQIIVTDMGTALLSGHQSIRLTEDQKMFTSLGLGEMGYGLPGAIGAAFSSPEKEVLCLNCDGGIMMNLQELQTIIENNLKIKIVIFNNDGYLMIKHTQKMVFKGNYVSVNKKTGIGLPDFKKVFEAFGFDYFSLKEGDDSDTIIKKVIDYKNPCILEVFMNPEQEFIPKVKGVSLPDKSILSLPIEEMSPLLSLKEVQESMLIEVSNKSKKVKR